MKFQVTLSYPEVQLPKRLTFAEIPAGSFFESDRHSDRFRLFYKVSSPSGWTYPAGALVFNVQASTLPPEFRDKDFFGKGEDYALAPDGVEATLRNVLEG